MNHDFFRELEPWRRRHNQEEIRGGKEEGKR